MNETFLLIGGNMGDRMANLKSATAAVAAQVGDVQRSSSIYETAAWGLTDQPAFLNQILLVNTSLSAIELLQTVLGIEDAMGRKRIMKLGPRVIDIDILFFNSDVISSDELVVPHPAIADRRFVLVPLVEIAPNFWHPIHKCTVSMLLSNCSDNLQVRLHHSA